MTNKISKYTDKEKFDIINNVTKQIEKNYGVKRSSYARWKTKEGYLFNLYFFFNVKMDRISFVLEVKPIYVDDLLWEILGFEKPLKPFSLRIMGGNAVTSVPILECKWNINGDAGYEESNLISLYQQIYSTIDTYISEFLEEHPNPDEYYYHNPEWTNQMLPILIQCHKHKYRQALSLLKEEMAKGNTGGTTFYMPDNSQKTAYQFVLEYCLKHINSQNV
ncbi:MAG: hypothetical protein NC095_09895 [Muribaculum sp.]|nr:hypothetical protein [Muribaculum sp.]